MDKRERLENTINGYQTDRLPVALWRRFPGDDQRSADFARSLVEYQQCYDWDFLNITPASTYSVVDYGVQTEWHGHSSGDRTITRWPVKRSLDWTELRLQDPSRGELAKHIETIRIVADQLGETVPLVMTVYSPLAQAARLTKPALLARHIRTRSDRFVSGLNNLTETTIRFLSALANTPISGICYVVEQANHDMLSEAEYKAVGVPYDQKILSEINSRWWLNLLHIRGQSPMFNTLLDYPVQAVNWDITNQRPDLPQGKSLLRGAVCGGLRAKPDIQTSTPAMLRNVVREAALSVNKRRLILAADDPVPVTTPLSNLRAVRTAANDLTKGSI